MLKYFLQHLWMSPMFFFIGWSEFLKEEYCRILILHIIAILFSFIINIFYIFSQWQVSVLIILLRKFLAGGICHSTRRLKGKNVVITGACSGIGKETARLVSLKGATVIMACIDVEQAEIVAHELHNQTGGEFVVMELDLSHFIKVKSFAEDFKKKFDVLDILINNAGVMFCPFGLTKDGFEMQFGINYLGHFLLTNLLIPVMSPSGRIINIGSMMHLLAQFNINTINDPKVYNPIIAYSNSKLACTLLTLSLSEKLKDTDIKTFSLHPGVGETQLGKYLPLGGDLIYRNILSLISKSASEAAQTTLYCALEANFHPSCYFTDCGVGAPSDIAQDKKLAAELWETSKIFVNSRIPDVKII